MAVPSFLAGAFRYFLRASVTDVATIIADLAVELVANGWTDLSGVGTGPFKSPVTAFGTYMSITLTATSATRLQFQCYDDTGVLVNNQISTNVDIDAGGTPVLYFTGPDYCCIESSRAVPECFWIAMLNMWPEDPSKVRTFIVCSRGPRNDAGTLQYQYVTDCYIRDIGQTAYISPSSNWSLRGVYSSYNASHMTRSAAGAWIGFPIDYIDRVQSTVLGRLPQCLQVDDGLAFGVTQVFPIDNGLTGTFRVMYLTTNYYRKFAIRVA
jgi:hypothetical protein